ncbi:MAG: CMGC/CDK protein kinase [Amphiamblys sp. WSBS2006]|nr:MAG: CMGC/CDK protein kinase [Amphiamblys sp. WSBS2006]
MTRKYLKHLVLFFLAASAIVGAADEYKEDDYVKLYKIGSGDFGAVSKIEEKKTGKIYILKTQKSDCHVYVRNEINALKQLDHPNIVKMMACSDITRRRRNEPFHIVLEHMPCDLDQAIKNHPEIKENTREILYQILSGVAHIHSKKLAHGDIKPANILIDPTTMSVKICDFGCCRVMREEENFWGLSMDGYHKDVLDVVTLMVCLYLPTGPFLDLVSFSMSSMDKVDGFFEAQRNGVLQPKNKLGRVYKKMKGAISENGLDLFLQLIASEKKGDTPSLQICWNTRSSQRGTSKDPLPEEPKQRVFLS